MNVTNGPGHQSASWIKSSRHRSTTRWRNPVTEAQSPQETVDRLLDRMATLSERMLRDSEEQLRQFDQRARDWLDRGEAATERLAQTIEKEVRGQIAALRREVDDWPAGSRIFERPSPGRRRPRSGQPRRPRPRRRQPGRRQPRRPRPRRRQQPKRRPRSGQPRRRQRGGSPDRRAAVLGSSSTDD